MTFETRTVTAEFETRTTSEELIVEGYATTFDQPYDMGPFWENVSRSAFDRTLSMQPDVRFLVDHEGQPLARTKSGTLDLSPDSTGLLTRARLCRADPDVQRIEPKMRRGDLSEMSFAFRVPAGGDAWDYTDPQRTMRTLQELNLAGGDVSVVTYPANPTTSISVRSKDLHEARCVFVEQTARELRAGRTLSQANIDKLAEVLRQLATADEALDVAQPALADVLGVPNPDADETGEPAEPPQRGMTADMAKRLIAAADLVIRAT